MPTLSGKNHSASDSPLGTTLPIGHIEDIAYSFLTPFSCPKMGGDKPKNYSSEAGSGTRRYRRHPLIFAGNCSPTLLIPYLEVRTITRYVNHSIRGWTPLVKGFTSTIDDVYGCPEG